MPVFISVTFPMKEKCEQSLKHTSLGYSLPIKSMCTSVSGKIKTNKALTVGTQKLKTKIHNQNAWWTTLGLGFYI